mmetsp:Transcript_24395/g.87178  ORF Transcript_24395/g.87178 Transcript_24395/m.87178 type:complete len:200 (+) Transcript_24395:1224-1823(+)
MESTIVTLPTASRVLQPDSKTSASSVRQSRFCAARRCVALLLRILGSSAHAGTARCQPSMPCAGRSYSGSSTWSPCLRASLRARASCHLCSAISSLTWRRRRPLRSRHAPKSLVALPLPTLPIERSMAPKPPLPPTSAPATRHRSSAPAAGTSAPAQRRAPHHSSSVGPPTRGQLMASRRATSAKIAAALEPDATIVRP